MNSITDNAWIAPEEIRLPDFIICGAMKSGTSTIHKILDSHPQIGIPKKEIHFFDHDDILEHPDYFIHQAEQWHTPDMHKQASAMWAHYAKYFPTDSENLFLGEDSTCYLASREAPKRIALQKKPIKLIICLRNPSDRCYSQYWHYVRSGRAMFDFNDTIKISPYDIINRSLYLPQIENFLKYIPKERIFFIIFEEFVKNKKETIDNLLKFLGAPVDLLPSDAYDTHTNKARIPKSIKLQLFTNRLIRSAVSHRYQKHWPNSSNKDAQKPNKWAHKIQGLVNTQVEARPPSMPEETKRFLDNYFENALSGLDELIGKNTTDYWFK